LAVRTFALFYFFLAARAPLFCTARNSASFTCTECALRGSAISARSIAGVSRLWESLLLSVAMLQMLPQNRPE
jgi:hypothetical protein